MPTLQTTLRNHDDGVIRAIASVWGVELTNKKPEVILNELYEVMLDEDRAEAVWDKLDGNERGALQLLLSMGQKMPSRQFERMYGSIRKMGRGAIERDEPHKNPESVAEGLYYRGFISETFEQGKAGATGVLYVPDDLVGVLPVHKTAYEGIEDEPAQMGSALTELDEDNLDNIQQADTSIVDDLTTLLAYLRSEQGAGVVEDNFVPEVADDLAPYFLDMSEQRLAFMLGVGLTGDILTTQEGQAFVKRSGLQKWLNLSRSQQMKALADAWRESTLYSDLWHVSGLYPDPDAGFPYDPLVGREAVLEFIAQFAPEQGWWSVDEFIETVKAVDPDFQRPGGDYESWYIRNYEGEYLHGFESWDAIDGALLEFYLTGPMYWLGMVDIAEDAARLTAYGRAFVQQTAYPTGATEDEPIEVRDDGVLVASRKVSRLDRFQVARFTTWGKDVPPYYYRLDAEGIEKGAEQGITTAHIAAFLKRQLDGAPLPDAIARLLDTWQSGATSEVTFEQLLVLRTTSPQVLDKIYDNPATRRYLGAKLGEMACVIRDGQADDLKVALGEMGVSTEIR